jgi:hypothetical protein
MRYGVLPVALAALLLTGQALSAGEKFDVKVLYAAKPGDARTKDFVAFLQQHFVRVGETDYEKFKPEEAKDFDVVIFDWPSIYPRDKDGKIEEKRAGLNSPKHLKLTEDFDRPAISAVTSSMSCRVRSRELPRVRRVQNRLLWLALVPKLYLGTDSAKLCFASAAPANREDAKQSFAECVPKQSLGTRDNDFGRLIVPHPL